MHDLATLRGRVLAVVLAAAACTAAFAAAGGAQPTAASWTATRTANVAATAVVPAAPTGLSCGSGSGLIASSIPLSWTAPAGTPPTGYTLSWTGGAGTGSLTTTGTSGSIPGGNLSVLGSSTVSVVANYGPWVSSPGTQTRTVTTVAVLSVIVSWTCT